MKKSIYILVILFILISFKSVAQKEVVPDWITIDQGLSQGFIASMYEDDEGFLWLGTKAGLDRYDGREFKHFNSSSIDITYSQNDQVRAISGTKDYILVGTEGDLYLYLPKYNSFHSFELGYGIGAITKDANNDFWIANLNGNLLKLQLEINIDEFVEDRIELKKYYSLKLIENVEVNQYFRFSVIKDHIVFFQQEGIYKTLKIFNVKEEKLVNLPAFIDKKVLSTDKIGYLTIEDKIVVFGYNDYELFVFEDKQWKSIQTNFKVQNALPLKNNNMVLFSTLDEYLFLDSNLFENDLAKKEEASFTINSNKKGLNTILEDRSGNIWVGTNGYGLLKISKRKIDIQHYFKGKSIYAAPFISKKGNIFIDNPTTEEKLSIINESQEYNHLQKLASENYNIKFLQNSVDNTIWAIAKKDLEWSIYKLGTKGFEFFKAIGYYDNGHSLLFDLNEETNELVVLINHHILFVNTENKAITAYDYKETSVFLCLSIINGNEYWIGTEAGIVKVSRQRDKISHELINRQNSKLLNNRVAAITHDSKNQDVIWIGTKGGGLHSYNTKEELFEHISAKYNFPDTVIYGILEDNNDNLWLSSNQGIIVFNKITKKVRNFLKNDGLQGNEFNTYATKKGPDGKLFFGGINGLNGFYPDRITKNEFLPESVITNFKINNQDFNHPIDIRFLDKIELNYKSNSFSFEFAALELSAPEKNMYSYYLEGAEPEWIHTTNDNKANYLNIPPGEYTFKLKTSNGDGLWNEHYKLLQISILPPWYKTNIAYILYATLISLLFISIVRFRENRINRLRQIEKAKLENEILENKIAYKQKDLADLANTISENMKWRDYLLKELKKIQAARGRTKSKYYNELINEIKVKTSIENSRTEHQNKIDILNNEFYSNLLTQYPNLTKNELRLCSLIKLDFSTKEIAMIQNIETRSVYINRSRLRKKMKLSAETDLVSVLKRI